MSELIIDPEFRDVIPQLSSEEYNTLEDSIKKEGCRESIITWNGIIIDGHNRYNICKKNNIPYNTMESKIKLETREDVIDWMYSNQLGRRNLTDENRTYIIGKQYEVRKKKKEDNLKQNSPIPQNEGSIKNETETAKIIAKEQNTSRSTVERAAEYARAVDTVVKNVGDDSLKQKILNGEVKINKKDMVDLSKKSEEVQKKVIKKMEEKPKKTEVQELFKEINKEEKDKEKKQELIEKSKNFDNSNLKNIIIHNKDFFNSYKELKQGSIDCIITDPPYSLEWIDNWEKLSEAAEYLLKPSGFLITYSGNMNLPKVMESLCKHLTFYWISSLLHTGNSQLVMPRNIKCEWKPILIYQNKPFKKLNNIFNDVINGSGREKDNHEWQQSLEELKTIISTFSEPNDTILDPFAGSGTTLLASDKLKRKSIGYEIDKNRYDILEARLKIGDN